MNLNWVDITVSIFLILSIGRGFLRGFIRSLFDIIALFIAVILAFYWYSGFSVFVSGYIKMPDEVLYITSFVVIWIAVYFVFLTLGNIIHKFLGGGLFGPANSLGGALIGAAKGLVTLWVVLYFLALVPLPAGFKKDIYEAPTISGLMPVIKQIGDSLFSFVPENLGIIKDHVKDKAPEPEKEDGRRSI